MTPVDRLKAVAGIVARAARLGWRDGAVCLLAWMLVHAATVRLRLARVLPWPTPTPDFWRSGGAAPASTRDLAPAVARLERLFAVATEYPALGVWCLPRGVALRRLLRLHGLDAELALGLRRLPEGASGHAWVVYHGRVLGQDEAFVGSFVRCEVS